MDVTDRRRETQKLTEARYGRLVKVLNEFDGWVSRLREDFGAGPANFVVDHRLVEGDAASVEDALAEREANGYELAILKTSEDGTEVRIVEGETGAAASVVVPSTLFSSPDLRERPQDVRRGCVEIVGHPPFDIVFGKKERHADTFGQLREAALELAKEGLQVSRFKGLGEMDAEELADTTMDPAHRTLIRVEVEDAAAADRVFSMLMGDQVEPRRAFIEQNARDVRFLDV